MKVRDDYVCPRCGSNRVTIHATTLPPLGEVDYWAPVRDEAFRCNACELQEYCQTDAGAAFVEFHRRWNDPIDIPATAEEIAERERERRQIDKETEAFERAWTWPDESRRVHDRAYRAAQLARRKAANCYSDRSVGPDGQIVSAYIPELALPSDLVARVLADPEDNAVRRELVRWLRAQAGILAPCTADFIEGQLRMAEAFAQDPRSDVRDQLTEPGFHREDPRPEWWRFPYLETSVSPLYELDVATGEGLVGDPKYYRGFIEHVAIKASRFLEIADELYGLAPIRQLSITYAKGPNHDDDALFAALLASPHLDRIRALRFPMREPDVDNQYTVLNALTDRDVARLAASDRLRGLRVLDLEDQHKLSITGFEALATSTKLPELSAVYCDIYHYFHPGTFTFGTVGGQQRHRVARPLDGYAPMLEAKYGWRPWLHVKEYYGSERPDVEAVIENPSALRMPRPGR